MSNCLECGNEYELHSTDGARCPKNQGNLVDGKLEFFATHFDDGLSEVERLRQALTEANALYNTVEAINLDLTERIAQDELAFGFMKEANTRLTEDVARLEAELAQCKHALDDEGEDVCTCGHLLDSHTKSGVHPCEECECKMFWAKVAK